jgi:hypothetical protein
MTENRLIRELLKKIEKLEKEKTDALKALEELGLDYDIMRFKYDRLKDNVCAECKRNIEALGV